MCTTLIKKKYRYIKLKNHFFKKKEKKKKKKKKGGLADRSYLGWLFGPPPPQGWPASHPLPPLGVVAYQGWATTTPFFFLLFCSFIYLYF
jgi:hypothetical protein